MSKISPLDRAMTESQLESAALEIAKALGFLAYHPAKSVRMAREGKKPYHLTAYRGDKGFPDWTYARKGQVLFVEYKMEGKYPDPDQRRWLETLGDLGRLWRPRDLSSGEILKTLTAIRDKGDA